MREQYHRNSRVPMQRSEQIRRRKQRHRRTRIISIMLGAVMLCALLILGVFIFGGKNKKEHPVTASVVINENSLQELMGQLSKIDRSQYTTASLSALDFRIKEAQTILDNGESDEKIDTAYMNLIIALQGLVSKGNAK